LRGDNGPSVGGGIGESGERHGGSGGGGALVAVAA
jgi:hypothetical protein